MDADDVEAVWELAEHRYLYIELLPERAGHALITVFVDAFDARLAGAADRGLEPSKQETYENGVRKAIFHYPDGNEVSFGGGPAWSVSREASSWLSAGASRAQLTPSSDLPSQY